MWLAQLTRAPALAGARLPRKSMVAPIQRERDHILLQPYGLTMRRLRGKELLLAQAKFDEAIAPLMVASLSEDQSRLLEALFHSSAGFVTESLRSALEMQLRSVRSGGLTWVTGGTAASAGSVVFEPIPVGSLTTAGIYVRGDEHGLGELSAVLKKAEEAKPAVDKDKLRVLDEPTVREWMSRRKGINFKVVGVGGVIEAAQYIRSGRGKEFPRGHTFRLASDLLRELGEL